MTAATETGLKALFEPSGVAVIGSFKEWGGLGLGVLRNMLDFGYKGPVYPVSLSGGEVMGSKVYSTIEEVSEPVDLAVVMTPPQTVPGIVERCAKNGVKAAVIVSENFAEAGRSGAMLQQELGEIGKRTGIRIVGPNTVGLLNVSNGLITIPYPVGYSRVQRGGIAYCSQTGIAMAQCQPLEDRGFRVSKMCDVGNKVDVDETDLLHYLADDPETTVVAMHLEDVRDGRAFMEAARRAAARKPLVLFKPGRSEAGSRASASHTGSMTGNDGVYDAAFRQVGALRVRSWQDFWDIPKALESGTLPGGDHVAIITHSGGAGVVAADVASESGLVVSPLSTRTIERLAGFSSRINGNPIDLGPVLATLDDPLGAQEEIVAAVLEDPNVDCVTLGLYVGVLSPVQPVAETFDRLRERTDKLVTIWVYGPRVLPVIELSRLLEEKGLPTFVEAEAAVRALGAARQYARFRASVDIMQTRP